MIHGQNVSAEEHIFHCRQCDEDRDRLKITIDGVGCFGASFAIIDTPEAHLVIVKELDVGLL